MGETPLAMYPPGSGFQEEGKSSRGPGGAGSCAASPSTKAMGTIFCPCSSGTGGGICAGPRGSALLGDGDQPSGAALGAAEAAEPAEGSLSRSPSRVATPFFSKPDVKLMKSRRKGWLLDDFFLSSATRVSRFFGDQIRKQTRAVTNSVS